MAKVETYVALLYSVVLGPGRRVIMSDLKAMASELDLANPRTLLATGNLVFETAATPVSALEHRLETAFEQTFGRHLTIIVRSAAHWQDTLTGNPFPEASVSDASHVIVRANREPVTQEIVAALEPYLANGERIAAVGNDLWIHFAKDIATSKLSAAITPKRAGIGTSRNWNTVQKIAAAMER